jgi:hypothetical protein
MRRILALALGLCVFASPALAGFTQVSGTGMNGAVFDTAFKVGTSGGVATTVALNAGDAVVLIIQENNTGTSTYSCANADGSGTNTWTLAPGDAHQGSAGSGLCYSILTNGISSGTTLTASSSVSGGFLLTSVAFRPAGTASFDTNATAATGTNGTSVTVGPTPTLACPGGAANCDVCVGAVEWTGAGTTASDATFTTTGGTGAGNPWVNAFKRVSATTAVSYSATNNNNPFGGALACFKDTVAGGSSSYGGGTTVGVGH